MEPKYVLIHQDYRPCWGSSKGQTVDVKGKMNGQGKTKIQSSKMRLGAPVVSRGPTDGQAAQIYRLTSGSRLGPGRADAERGRKPRCRPPDPARPRAPRALNEAPPESGTSLSNKGAERDFTNMHKSRSV